MSSNTPVWDRGLRPALPSLDSNLTTDVAVIGLGGSGLTCVAELLTMGRRVLGIDAVDVAAGAAGRNGGILRAGTADFHHLAVEKIGRDRALRLYRMTVEALRRIADETPDAVRLTGSLRIAGSDDERADCARQRDAMRADGIAVEDYDGPMGYGLCVPGDAALDPVERCRALARDTLRRGARLFARTRALAFTGNEVATPNGRIRCDRVIVTVDGRLEALVPELAGAVRTARLQMLATAPTREVEIPCPVSARYGFDYWQQLPDGAIALGGGRDLAMDDEWTASDEPTPFIQAHLERVLRERLQVSAPITHRWAASVSYSSTGVPVLTEVRPGVWAIGGYSGTGNLLGALCGRAVARAACGEPPELASLLRR